MPVRVTEFDTYKQCPRKWWYDSRYETEPSRGLVTGTWFHLMMQAFNLDRAVKDESLLHDPPERLVYEDNPWGPTEFGTSIKEVTSALNHTWKAMPIEHQDEWEGDNLPEQIQRMLAEYTDFYQQNIEAEKILAVEQRLSDEDITGQIDVIIETEGGYRFLRDYKTTGRYAPRFNPITGPFERPQIHMYARLAAASDLPKIHGLEYDFVSSKKPKLPTLNKDGTASKRQIATTRLTYIAWCLQHDVEPDRALLDTASSFFSRWHFPVSQEVSDNLSKEIRVIARRMADDDPMFHWRCSSKLCSWCGHADRCRKDLGI